MREAIRRSSRDIDATRIETYATPGLPDVVLCDEHGRFHFVELKAARSNAVSLRPHQIAWLTRHRRASVWVLIRKTSVLDQLYLYPGSAAVELRAKGLAGVLPHFYCEGRIDWNAVLNAVCN